MSISTPKKSAFDILMNKTNRQKEAATSPAPKLNLVQKKLKAEQQKDDDDVIFLNNDGRDVQIETPPLPESRPDPTTYQHTHQYIGWFETVKQRVSYYIIS